MLRFYSLGTLPAASLPSPTTLRAIPAAMAELHRSIHMTPAMKAGIVRKSWEMAALLQAAH